LQHMQRQWQHPVATKPTNSKPVQGCHDTRKAPQEAVQGVLARPRCCIPSKLRNAAPRASWREIRASWRLWPPGLIEAGMTDLAGGLTGAGVYSQPKPEIARAVQGLFASVFSAPLGVVQHGGQSTGGAIDGHSNAMRGKLHSLVTVSAIAVQVKLLVRLFSLWKRHSKCTSHQARTRPKVGQN